MTNSQATSVAGLKLHRSTIAACFVFLRKISRTAFWDFCNKIARLADVQSQSQCAGKRRTGDTNSAKRQHVRRSCNYFGRPAGLVTTRRNCRSWERPFSFNNPSGPTSFFQTVARIHMRSTQRPSQSYRSSPIRPDGDGPAD